MKFLKRSLVIVLAVIMIFSFSGCNQATFISNNTINSLVSTYGERPQAVVLMEYTTETDETIQLEITYDLLLRYVPITVVNFINLVEEGYYNEIDDEGTVTSHLFDNKLTTGSSSISVGLYTRRVSAEDVTTYHYAPELDYTILGEFYQNDWIHALTDAQIAEYEDEGENPEDYDNNPSFELFSLAMHHANSETAFDAASSAFFLTTSSTSTENHRNYAVFAYLSKITVRKLVDDNFVDLYTDLEQVPADVVYDLNNLTATESKKVVDEEGDTRDISMFKYLIRLVSIHMADATKDYSKLPKDYKIVG